ncbi:hypothetical protein [Actinomadura opuntiae]|uniref:hypothetical protein n=1 Tax=Actinomadura sp. OS1-43 TaxID=604315 RepID=UPI00255AF522|nr:hypothetical protein [Actinomadura sp. OS1-43]MDL4819031.1 hypothetical protein [Actinomadura sp. OS1-43]
MSETDDLRREPPEDDASDAAGTGDANEADRAEQLAGLDEDGDAAAEWPGQVPMDVNEADAAEQHREIPLDEDDYR